MKVKDVKRECVNMGKRMDIIGIYKESERERESCILHVSYFTLEVTKNFCSALVTHFVVGNLSKNKR